MFFCWDKIDNFGVMPGLFYIIWHWQKICLLWSLLQIVILIIVEQIELVSSFIYSQPYANMESRLYNTLQMDL